MTKTIAFQGVAGAYSDLACHSVFPDDKTLPCLSFEDAFAAVQEGRADLAMIPIENSIAGRVADVHLLLPDAGLTIIGEHYQPVVHHLLAVPGAKLSDIREAHSHVQAVAQCRQFLREKNITGVVTHDTAGAAAEIAKIGDKAVAAIASELAGKMYGLQSLAADIATLRNNTTRFLILAREAKKREAGPTITTLVYRVRSVPASLYKTLGGFATNGVNITKIESYLVGGNFSAAQFRLDVEGHPDDGPLRNALDELAFFAHEVKILGSYPAHPFRQVK